MIILLSPSKTINPKPVEADVQPTQPRFVDEAEQLVGSVNTLGTKLASVLDVSDKLAEMNRERFAEWSAQPTKEQGSMAAWTYRGETFFGLSIEEMSDEARAYAQDHVRIVTGLYGLLRPQDVIMPYRLEMKTKLNGAWGKNLYEFWGSKLSKEIEIQKPEFVLNCASVEYSKAIAKHLPKSIAVITVKFLSHSKTGLRSKMVFAKYSRGLMARWAVENRITDPQDLKNFDVEGYEYNAEHSDESTYAFVSPPDFTIKGRFTIL